MGKLNIIDTHQHFWRYRETDLCWIDKGSILAQNYLPADVLKMMVSSGVGKSIAVQARQSSRETEFLLGLAAKYDSIAGVVGWVDLMSSNIEDNLKRYESEEMLLGFRHIIQDEQDDRFILNKEFIKNIKKLARYDYLYEILVYSKHLGYVNQFLHNFTEQRFILDHIGKPDISKDGLDEVWWKNISEIAEYPYIYCKLSGLFTQAKAGTKYRYFYPYIDKVIEVFGVDRLIWGSDWPVSSTRCEYSDTLDFFKSYLPQNIHKKVFRTNALNIYKLESYINYG